MIEKEIKLYINDLDLINNKLRKQDKSGGERIHELTVMYDNKERLMHTTDGRIRLRTKTKQNGERHLSLSYKKPIVRHNIKQELEFETSVEDSDATERILAAMGFFPVSSYERYRSNYLINGTHISVDEFPFGNYIEIEGVNSEKILQCVVELGLDPSDHIPLSYDSLYIRLEKMKGVKPTPHIRFKI